MAKFAIVSSSDLTAFDRMDASFHILRKETEKEAAKFEETIERTEAITLAVETLNKVPLKYRRDINALVRGSGNRPPDLHAQERAVREYPYIALAVFSRSAEDIAEHYRNEARKAEETAALFCKLK